MEFLASCASVAPTPHPKVLAIKPLHKIVYQCICNARGSSIKSPLKKISCKRRTATEVKFLMPFKVEEFTQASFLLIPKRLIHSYLFTLEFIPSINEKGGIFFLFSFVFFLFVVLTEIFLEHRN